MTAESAASQIGEVGNHAASTNDAVIAAKDFYLSNAEVDKLVQEFQQDPRLKDLETRHLRNVVATAANHKGAAPDLEDVCNKLSNLSAETGNIKPVDPERMKQLLSRTEGRAAQGATEKIVRLPNKASSWRDSLTTEHKMNAGIWMAGAALSLLGTYNAARNSVAKDEQGNTEIRWTQVSVALLQGCLGAACAYMGAQTLRSGAIR